MGEIPGAGVVVTISPAFSWRRIVDFPASTSPTTMTRVTFFSRSSSNSLDSVRPIVDWTGTALLSVLRME